MQILATVFPSAAHSYCFFIFYLRVSSLPVLSAQKHLKTIALLFKVKRNKTNLWDVWQWNFLLKIEEEKKHEATSNSTNSWSFNFLL